MISALISIILLLCVVGLLWWAIQRLLPLIPLPEPIRTVVYVLLVVVIGFLVLYAIAGIFGIGGVSLRGLW